MRYRVPTPLHVELRFRAAIDRTEGRKIFAAGTLHAGETLCAEAEGIFIGANPEKFAALLEKRARWESERAGGR